ncbi:MAG: hypothetical protein MK329_09715 [Pirellulales bacterium]|nr:hypothetical protein [Pirellulales bacterium]
MRQLPIGLYLLALIGFFLPWSSLSCTIPGAGTVGIYQSGLQMVTKGYTEKKPSGDMGGMGGGMGDMGGGLINGGGFAGGMGDTDEIAEDLEPAFLPIATVLLTIIALVLAIKSSAAANLVGILAGATALLQMVIGFPLKNVIESGEGGGEMGMDPAEILAEMYHIEYGFWITVAASVLAGVIGLAAGSAGESSDTVTATAVPAPVPATPVPATPEAAPPVADASPETEPSAESDTDGDAGGDS